MTAAIQYPSGPDSFEDLQNTIRDLEAKVSELRESQDSPALYRVEETRDLEVRKHALEGEIAELEAHPPRLFKKKHREKIDDLRIDVKYLNSKLATIASDRDRYMSSLSSQISQTESDLELARRELAGHRPEIRSFKAPQRREQAPEPREPAPERRVQSPMQEPDRRDQEAFYRDTMRPAVLALMEARMDDDRLRFLDGYQEATALLGQVKRDDLGEQAQQKCRILYDYVLGFPCAEWYPGDPHELIADLREQTRTWGSSADSEDVPFELAVANGLMIMPLHVMRKLERSPKAGDVRHRMREIEENCPGALETSERKCIHVMRNADADWQRQLAEKGLDRLNQIRR